MCLQVLARPLWLVPPVMCISPRSTWTNSPNLRKSKFSLNELVKGVMPRSSVNALSDLCSSLLKGGNSASIAAIASGLFPKKQISVIQITTARMVQIEIKWNLITTTW